MTNHNLEILQALWDIGKALDKIEFSDNSDALNGLANAIEEAGNRIGYGLYAVAESLSEIASAMRASARLVEDSEK